LQKLPKTSNSLQLTASDILTQVTTRSSSRDETANVNFLRRHRTRNNKTYCSFNVTEVYKKIITVKSDLQLNLKVVMSK